MEERDSAWYDLTSFTHWAGGIDNETFLEPVKSGALSAAENMEEHSRRMAGGSAFSIDFFDFSGNEPNNRYPEFADDYTMGTPIFDEIPLEEARNVQAQGGMQESQSPRPHTYAGVSSEAPKPLHPKKKGHAAKRPRRSNRRLWHFVEFALSLVSLGLFLSVIASKGIKIDQNLVKLVTVNFDAIKVSPTPVESGSDSDSVDYAESTGSAVPELDGFGEVNLDASYL